MVERHAGARHSEVEARAAGERRVAVEDLDGAPLAAKQRGSGRTARPRPKNKRPRHFTYMSAMSVNTIVKMATVSTMPSAAR